jgi:hypothetical protein
MCFIWWLIWYTLRVALSIATTQPISLSPFRPVVLSLAKRDKRRVVAMSSCRSVACEARQTACCRAARCGDVASLMHMQIVDLSIWAERQFDIATTRRTTTRRLVCFISDRTIVRQRAVWRFVVLSLAITRRTKVFRISHLRFNFWLWLRDIKFACTWCSTGDLCKVSVPRQ